MRRLIANLQEFEPGIDGEQIADLLWLAQYITIADSTQLEPESDSSDQVPLSTEQPETHPSEGRVDPSLPDSVSSPVASVYTSESLEEKESTDSVTRLPFRAAAPRALRKPIELERALRPLMCKVPSRSRYQLDEVATAERIAETRMPTPVKIAERERWLDVALVVEETSLTEIWRKSIDDFQRLLEHLGAFRDVRVWTMRRRREPPALSEKAAEKKSEASELELLPRHRRRDTQRRVHSHQELIDPSQRRLILVLSDCTSVSWWEGKIHSWLKDWAAVNRVSVVQLLPQRMWERGILGEGLPVSLRSRIPGTPNHQWQIEGLPVWRSEVPQSELTLPVVTLEPEALTQWAKAIAGYSEFTTAGVLFEAGWQQEMEMPVLPPEIFSESLSLEAIAQQAQQCVAQFREDASPMARRLAVLMAAVPVDLAVVGLIQETLLKQEAKQVHVAEVYLGGLMQQVGESDAVRYEFKPGVRTELRKSLPKSEARQVLEAVSGYIAERLNLPMRSLDAVLMADLPEGAEDEILPFAEIAIETLRQMGGNYAAFATEVEARHVSKSSSSSTPESTEAVETIESQETQQNWFQKLNLQSFTVEIASLVFEEELSKSNFETIYINKQGKIIRTQKCEAYYYEEPLETIPPAPLKKRGKSKIRSPQPPLERGADLTSPITLIAIPEGEYWMGSPEEEKDRFGGESPQHRVKVPAFFMSQTPITEAQWKFVANLPQEQKALETNPSNKGDDHPVVNIRWQDAIEFCARLSRHTGRNYRLPSEAEWEYACRALPLDSESIQNTPPFHFGETITSELANYDGSVIYQEEPQGENRGKTTSVRSFKPNAFGLYDMHGNVWEWCLDPWHENYQGAPSDSRVWDEEDNDNSYQNILDSTNVLIKDDRSHVLRGGSWVDDPRNCRSAYRYDFGYRYNNGFRVVCAPQDL